jgi:hypothetical protein
VYCDNVSACYLSNNMVQHQRTKHIEINLHFIRNKVAARIVRVFHVSTTSLLELFVLCCIIGTWAP